MIGSTECGRNLHRREVESGKAGRVQRDTYFSLLPTNQDRGRNVRCLLDSIVNLRGHSPEFVVTVTLAPKRQGKNGDIVNRAELHQRRRCARRYEVHVSRELLV